MSRVRIDEKGFEALLKSPALRDRMQQEADAVASHIDHTTHSGEHVDVITGTFVTDRVDAAVTLAHPAGMAIEAKHGLLAHALAAEGLELRRKG